MSRRKKDPLRPLTADERDALALSSRSQAAPAAEVARAKMLLLVAAGSNYQEAARAVGRRSGDPASALVARFNREGLVPLDPPGGTAPRLGRPAVGVHLHPLVRASRGGLHLPAGPHLVPHRHRRAPAQGRRRHRHRPGRRAQKKLIEEAYTLGEGLGLSVWCCDQAGPFQTVPQPGQGWQPEGEPARQPHEYIRNGTAKVLTLFHPADGRVRVEGVTSCPNAVLHPWLKRELSEVLAELPDPPPAAATSRQEWERWQAGLAVKPTLSAELPPLRLLLVLDNLTGHKTPEFVLWLFAHGVMPLYTPLSGSWLNLAESIQRVLKRRALAGQHPGTPEEIIAAFEAVAGHWNEDPTPFEWGGKRKRRRDRQRERHHRAGGSGGFTRRPIRRGSGESYGHGRGK